MTQPPDEERTQREQAYLTGRWQNQKDYYSKRVSSNKKWHQRIRLFVAVTSVIVPVLLSINAIDKIFPTILSSLIAIATVTEGVYGFGDNWRNFRQTLEVLKREKVLYEAKVEPYNAPDTAFSLFVTNCETAIAKETGSYFEKDQEKK